MGCHEYPVEFPALFLEHTGGHLYSGLAKHGYATTGNLGKGVGASYHYPLHPASHEQGRARGRLAVMRAGLKSDVDRAPRKQSAVGNRIYGIDLGMGLTVAAVIPLAYYPAVAHHHGSHHGVGRDISGTAPRKLQGTAHIKFVYFQSPLRFIRSTRCSTASASGMFFSTHSLPL